jgi:hypothetical protein
LATRSSTWSTVVAPAGSSMAPRRNTHGAGASVNSANLTLDDPLLIASTERFALGRRASLVVLEIALPRLSVVSPEATCLRSNPNAGERLGTHCTLKDSLRPARVAVQWCGLVKSACQLGLHDGR